jgi:hypothetical protein
MFPELSFRKTARSLYEIPVCMHLKVAETVLQGSNKGICYGRDDRSYLQTDTRNNIYTADFTAYRLTFLKVLLFLVESGRHE